MKRNILKQLVNNIKVLVRQEKYYRMVLKLRPVLEGFRYIGLLKSCSISVFKASFSLLSKAKWKFMLNYCITLFKEGVSICF